MFRFENPVIAAVRSKEEFLSALSSPVDVVFLLKSTINDLKEAIDAKAKVTPTEPISVS